MGTENSPLAVSLKCSNCGAGLDIASDLDVLACGYCGARQLVRREGGTVSLRLLEETVAAVKTNTDRIAAELEIRRAYNNCVDLDGKMEKITQKLTGGQPLNANWGCAEMALAALVGVAGMGLFAAKVETEWTVAVALLMPVGVVYVRRFVLYQMKRRALLQRRKELKQEKQQLERRIQELRAALSR